ncbi:polyamine aminopropyltransferase [soil metagenome]
MPIRGDRLSMNVGVREHLVSRTTEFQTIDVYETEILGRALLLDGHIQLTTFDERAYHECLVQIPMLSLPNARRALVIGGGDGGVLRELVKWPNLERIDMVEIDRGVIEVSQDHLPSVSDGAFENPRVNLTIGDAFEFVKTATEPYDLVVSDSTDVYEGEEGNLSEMLFTEGFYRDIRRLLAPGGIVVTQADNSVFCPYSLEAISAEFGRVFPFVGSYFGLVPSFGGYSGFCFASEETRLRQDFQPPAYLDLVYLNETTYQLALNPPKFS